MTTINSDLHVVLPLRVGEDGKPQSWAYHTPISLAVFEANFRILAATKAALFKDGPRYAFEVGSRVAALHLRDAGRKDAQERLDVDEQGQPRDGGVNALLGELRRLTMTAVPAGAAWESVPLPVAQSRGLLDAEDIAEVDSALVFFTCVYYLTPRHQRASIAGVIASVMSGSITSLPLTDWTASLPTSMPVAISAAAA